MDVKFDFVIRFVVELGRVSNFVGLVGGFSFVSIMLFRVLLIFVNELGNVRIFVGLIGGFLCVI